MDAISSAGIVKQTSLLSTAPIPLKVYSVLWFATVSVSILSEAHSDILLVPGKLSQFSLFFANYNPHN